MSASVASCCTWFSRSVIAMSIPYSEQCLLVPWAEKESRGHIFWKKKWGSLTHSFFATVGQKARTAHVPSALNQTRPGLSALALSATGRLSFGFSIFWIRRNVLMLFYLLPRNGSLVHLREALTEISCLHKDRGGKKTSFSRKTRKERKKLFWV